MWWRCRSRDLTRHVKSASIAVVREQAASPVMMRGGDLALATDAGTATLTIAT
jgi:hypothetical protein